MKSRSLAFHLSTAGIVVSFFVLSLVWQIQVQAQGGEADVRYPEVRAFVVPVNGPNLSGEVPLLDRDLAGQAAAPQRIAPKEMYLVPVEGPNLTGKVPALNKDTAIPLHEKGIDVTAAYQPGQWYDHYAYYDLGGTEVEQYTNFQERTYGQYIWFQSWRNNNGGADRWFKDAWTGSTYRAFYTWLNTTPTFNPGQEYTDGYGTRLQSYFQTNSSSCPCWLADYRVGTN